MNRPSVPFPSDTVANFLDVASMSDPPILHISFDDCTLLLCRSEQYDYEAFKKVVLAQLYREAMARPSDLLLFGSEMNDIEMAKVALRMLTAGRVWREVYFIAEKFWS